MQRHLNKKSLLKKIQVNMTSSIEIFIPSKPVSASRPRVTSYGSYYSKSYMAYRKETWKFLKTIAKQYPPKEKTLFEVHTEFICYKPARPANKDCPRYDLDNMLKAVWDAITHSKLIWHDDIQIVRSKSSKRYQNKGEPYGTKITIIEREVQILYFSQHSIL